MSPSSLSGSSFWLTLLHRYVSVPYFWNMRASCYWDQVTIKFDLFESPAKILWIWINNSIDDGCAATTTSFDQFRSPLSWPVCECTLCKAVPEALKTSECNYWSHSGRILNGPFIHRRSRWHAESRLFNRFEVCSRVDIGRQSCGTNGR